MICVEYVVFFVPLHRQKQYGNLPYIIGIRSIIYKFSRLLCRKSGTLLLLPMSIMENDVGR